MSTTSPPRTDPDAPARARRVEQRARTRREAHRARSRGVILTLTAFAVLVLSGMLAWSPPPVPNLGIDSEPAAASAPAAATPRGAPAAADAGEWRTAAPLLLTVASTQVPSSPEVSADVGTADDRLGAASAREGAPHETTTPQVGRDRSSGRVAPSVTILEPGAVVAEQPVASADAAPERPIGRDGGGSSGFVTVDVTISEAMDVGELTSALIGLEPFDYLDRGDGTITIDPTWVDRYIVTAPVPILGSVHCHEAIVAPLGAALQQIVDEGLADAVDADDYGGCWVPRRIDRDPAKPLSMHAWGLAIDLNVATNGLGATPTMDARVVEIFRTHGFVWGGAWSRPDGMHFEWHITP